MDLSSLPPTYSLIQAVVQFWKRQIALLVAERMYIGVDIRLKKLITWRVRRKIASRLTPYRPQLRSDHERRNIEEKVRQREAITLWNHDCITSDHKPRRQQIRKDEEYDGRMAKAQTALRVRRANKRWTRLGRRKQRPRRRPVARRYAYLSNTFPKKQ